MKRFSKMLSLALALMMIIPMFTSLMPLEAEAATSFRTAYQNKFDFEDAVADASLSEGYLARRAAKGFVVKGVDSPDGVTTSNAFKVVTETVGDETNQYIQPTTARNSFALYDENALIWQMPYRLTFKVKAENGLAKTDAYGVSGSETGYNYAAFLGVAKTKAAGTRTTVLYVRGRTINWGSAGGNPICTLAANQWHEITVDVDPIGGSVSFKIEQLTFDTANDANKLTAKSQGTANSDGTVITSSRTGVVSAPSDLTSGAALYLGRHYGNITADFCYDDIFLGTCIDEHLDFEDAVIKTTGKDQTTPPPTVEEMIREFATIHSTSADSTLKYSREEDANGNHYVKQSLNGYAGGDGKSGTMGFYADATALAKAGKSFTISASFMHDGNYFNTNAFNTIRFSGTGVTTFTPFTLSFGRVGYGSDSGLMMFRKVADNSYEGVSMTANQWYDVVLTFDPTDWTYTVSLNNELLYFHKDSTGYVGHSKATTTWDEWKDGVYGTEGQEGYLKLTDDIMTTEGKLAATTSGGVGGGINTAKSGFSLSVHFMHATGNFSGNSNKNTAKYMFGDNFKLSNKAAGGTIESALDFEYVPAEITEKVDWWQDSSFENSWTRSISDATGTKAVLQDWEVVDDPANSGRGKVLHNYAGKWGVFSVRDTENVLPQYLVDISFDFYATKLSTNASNKGTNINLFKVFTKGSDAESRKNTNAFTALQTYFDNIYIQDNGGRVAGKGISLKTWYNVRLRLNFVEGWFETYLDDQIISFTVDGVAKTRQTFTETMEDGKFTYSPDMLDQLQFEIFSTWTTNCYSDHYLDNVKIQSVEPLINSVQTEFTDYEVLSADFEDSAWLTSAKAGEIENLSLSYSKSSILADAGIVGNHALNLTGTVGGEMEYALASMGGYDECFTMEVSLAYGNSHGSALDIAALSDLSLEEDITLLSAMGSNSDATLTGALFFDQNGSRYYLCDADGEIYNMAAATAEATVFTDIALVVDAANDRYAIYLNGSPAYYRQNGEGGAVNRANDIALGMGSKTAFDYPTLTMLSCDGSANTSNILFVDDLKVASVKNGLTPVLVGYQANDVSGNAIRFLATVDTLYYSEIGFIVEANGVTKEISTNKVFSSVMANGSTVTAKDEGGRYLTALVVKDITETVTFRVTPYVVFFGERLVGASSEITFTAG